MSRARLAAIAAVLVLLGAGRAARAEDAAMEQAKALFNAGAQAYERAQYAAAIQAFEQAFKLAPRPGILFSMAQAHRRQFFLDQRGEHLDRAIKLYRDYLEMVPKGGRRGDVAQALAELDPIAARRAASAPAGPEEGPDAAGQPAEPPAQTRLMISSQIDEAVVSVDGGEPAELPFIEEVEPGKHRIKITAPGHFDDDREIVAVEGGVVALDIPLREKPARLAIAAEERSDISIDGRLVGVAPLAQPIELPAGRHLVTVTRSGRAPFSREVTLDRGEQGEVVVAFETTAQRYAALTLIGTGIGGAVVGGVLTAVALHQQGVAEAIHEETLRGNVPAERRQEYTDALVAREDTRRAAGIVFIGGSIAGGVGVLLYLTDFPKVGPVLPGGDQPKAPAPERRPRRGEPSMEVSAIPVLGPGVAGASVVGRF